MWNEHFGIGKNLNYFLEASLLLEKVGLIHILTDIWDKDNQTYH